MEHVVHRSARSVGVVPTLRAAVGLLTRLPVGVVADVPGAAAFALVGAVIGGLAAAALVVLALAGEPVLGAIAAVGVLAAVSGGLHLDGLADTADALVAPDAYAAERAREDPSVGPGGVVALLVVMGVEVAALASVAASWGPAVAASVVVVGGAVSRWLPVVAVVLLRDRVGHDGLGAWFSNAVSWRDAIVGAVTVAIVVGAGMTSGAWALGPGALIGGTAGLVATAFITGLRGRLDGDGLGASVEITLTATLVCLAVIAP
ncbi:MAG: adenosylcobinamide-GDP ribazoletransferase [Chloroflexota bacterium]|nr:adenosylcobinamide-GDP ribazoletransferase [Chloroflexota bacterium]